MKTDKLRPKYKKGQKVWCILGSKAYEVTVTKIRLGGDSIKYSLRPDSKDKSISEMEVYFYEPQVFKTKKQAVKQELKLLKGVMDSLKEDMKKLEESIK